MLYILAIFLPPVAVLLCGKPGKAILNLILTLIVWLPGVIHAFIVISQTENEKRNRKMLEEARRYH
ncbi:YqaE/Pmp3 family membrane protein [Paenibacillus wenxiniae]|uniref:YqaE/Pmp3 family membrane protein n=1 Tax=Paenibacillus wenxiniae TaxID=1636843 RepID=A0ABW4RMJ5_9BACL